VDDPDKPLTTALYRLYTLSPWGWRFCVILAALALLAWVVMGSRGVTTWLLQKVLWLMAALIVVRLLAAMFL
jgi:hypothetical protein